MESTIYSRFKELVKMTRIILQSSTNAPVSIMQVLTVWSTA